MERSKRDEDRPVFWRRGAAPPWRKGGRSSSFSSSSSHRSASSPSYVGSWRASARQADPLSKRDEVIVGHIPGGNRGGAEGIADDSESGGVAVVGTCPDMCPAKERAQRERLRDLSLFERLDGNPGRTSPHLAVKKFCRTISNVQLLTSDIRPLPVLQDTLRYLLKLLTSSDHPFEVVHDFIFDRTRSIRQDISIQQISNNHTISIYEEMVRFHIISHQRLLRCNDKSNVSSLVHLNMEQLVKVLMSLYDMYGTKCNPGTISKKEAEIYSFYALLHLNHNRQTVGDSLSLWYRKLSSAILKSKEMRFARAALRYFQMGNYVGFFNILATDASYLQLCLVEPIVNEERSLHATDLGFVKVDWFEFHDRYSYCNSPLLLLLLSLETGRSRFKFRTKQFCSLKLGGTNVALHFVENVVPVEMTLLRTNNSQNKVRAQALSCLNSSGYKLHPYPLARLSKLLLMKEDDLESLCNACGLNIATDEAACSKALPAKQNFHPPKEDFQHYSFVGSERLQRWQALCEDAGTLLDADMD